MGICPFISASTFDADGAFVELHTENCLGASCQLWDAIEENCSVASNRIVNQHMHASHWHRRRHECSDKSLTCGRDLIEGNIPRASILVNEFTGGEDLDDNGMIYGQDFMISDSADKPPILSALESNPNWIDPETTMSWSDYTSS